MIKRMIKHLGSFSLLDEPNGAEHKILNLSEESEEERI